MKHFTILNPTAGSYSTREHQKISQALAGLEGKVLTTSNLPELEQELQRHDTYSPNILGIGGGDGTVSCTLSKIKKIWGSIPEYVATYAMGTMNNVAIPVGGSDGLIDKIKRYTRIGNTKPVQLAKYVAKIMQEEKELKIEKLAPLNINGQFGFNVGFGMTAKLVWMYYGKTIDQHTRAHQLLQQCSSQTYGTVVEQIASEEQKSGMIQAGKTALESINAMYDPCSPISQFFNAPFEAKIYVDGHKMNFNEPLTGIYLASYEQQNVGVFRGTPLPHARAVPGSMEVLISSATVKDVVLSLPAIMQGKPMRKTQYRQARELRVESDKVMIGQVDGEFVFGKEFVIRPDEALRFISLR